MFIVLLKFSGDKGKASQFMEDHKRWIKRGFDDGVFFLVAGAFNLSSAARSSRIIRRCPSFKAG
jgi:hypothetical protein